ncbi:CRISPR-associated endoribonuclease Cas6 [Frankia sp. AiPs1]|uniref:CRISPR-associated endoribonuclease Cas6 n=1 Tax=Frankia sp. AiPa1 TaxID=573492 RepID=UPI00202AE8DC|nr:CRISPR-associated endoribonuclease Cas6 [Frankia sp. AiPa1]MCL9758042.1 CRISPR-associated protein Cas6 [Frankia sp. AiPa1]
MRLRVAVHTRAREIPWRSVHAPGRALCYRMLGEVDPALARTLHEEGWGPHRMVPFGYGPPVFPRATRVRGRYATGGAGYLDLGSPLFALVDAWAKVVIGIPLIDWGGVALNVLGVELMEAPSFESGHATLRTVTPVVVKGSGRGPDGVRTSRQAFLLPGEPEFAAYFATGLRRKAQSIGVDPDVTVEEISWVGARRMVEAGKGAKIGAPLEARLRGAPETLRSLWSWGLGQSTSVGFGWVAA